MIYSGYTFGTPCHDTDYKMILQLENDSRMHGCYHLLYNADKMDNVSPYNPHEVSLSLTMLTIIL